MKGLQKKYGADKLQVLMLSVDGERSTRTNDEARKSDETILAKQGVAWPNILLPHSWQTSQELFNVDGYGLILVDPEGVVRGIDLTGEDLEPVLKSIYKY